jgi:hypothetical protein
MQLQEQLLWQAGKHRLASHFYTDYHMFTFFPSGVGRGSVVCIFFWLHAVPVCRLTLPFAV